MIDFLSTKLSISVEDYERQVKIIERFPLMLRCSSTSKILEYSYQKAAPSSWSLKKFINKRIKPYSGNLEIELRMPSGKRVHQGMTLGNLRKAYAKEVA